MNAATLHGWLRRPGPGGTVRIGCFATVVAAANTASGQVTLPVGFGLVAPAGVYLAGAALYLRGLIQHWSGPGWALTAALAGAGLSAVTASPGLAGASVLAFTVAEATAIATQCLLPAQGPFALVIAAAVGGLADSVVFLAVGFGSLSMLAGLILAKAWVIALTSLTITSARRVCRGWSV